MSCASPVCGQLNLLRAPPPSGVVVAQIIGYSNAVLAGGNDKQGFPMKQGIMTNNRVRLLLGAGESRDHIALCARKKLLVFLHAS